MTIDKGIQKHISSEYFSDGQKETLEYNKEILLNNESKSSLFEIIQKILQLYRKNPLFSQEYANTLIYNIDENHPQIVYIISYIYQTLLGLSLETGDLTYFINNEKNISTVKDLLETREDATLQEVEKHRKYLFLYTLDQYHQKISSHHSSTETEELKEKITKYGYPEISTAIHIGHIYTSVQNQQKKSSLSQEINNLVNQIEATEMRIVMPSKAQLYLSRLQSHEETLSLKDITQTINEKLLHSNKTKTINNPGEILSQKRRMWGEKSKKIGGMRNMRYHFLLRLVGFLQDYQETTPKQTEIGISNDELNELYRTLRLLVEQDIPGEDRKGYNIKNKQDLQKWLITVIESEVGKGDYKLDIDYYKTYLDKKVRNHDYTYEPSTETYTHHDEHATQYTQQDIEQRIFKEETIAYMHSLQSIFEQDYEQDGKPLEGKEKEKRWKQIITKTSLWQERAERYSIYHLQDPITLEEITKYFQQYTTTKDDIFAVRGEGDMISTPLYGTLQAARDYFLGTYKEQLQGYTDRLISCQTTTQDHFDIIKGQLKRGITHDTNMQNSSSVPGNEDNSTTKTWDAYILQTVKTLHQNICEAMHIERLRIVATIHGRQVYIGTTPDALEGYEDIMSLYDEHSPTKDTILQAKDLQKHTPEQYHSQRLTYQEHTANNKKETNFWPNSHVIFPQSQFHQFSEDIERIQFDIGPYQHLYLEENTKHHLLPLMYTLVWLQYQYDILKDKLDHAILLSKIEVPHIYKGIREEFISLNKEYINEGLILIRQTSNKAPHVEGIYEFINHLESTGYLIHPTTKRRFDYEQIISSLTKEDINKDILLTIYVNQYPKMTVEDRTNIKEYLAYRFEHQQGSGLVQSLPQNNVPQYIQLGIYYELIKSLQQYEYTSQEIGQLFNLWSQHGIISSNTITPLLTHHQDDNNRKKESALQAPKLKKDTTYNFSGEIITSIDDLHEIYQYVQKLIDTQLILKYFPSYSLRDRKRYYIHKLRKHIGTSTITGVQRHGHGNSDIEDKPGPDDEHLNPFGIAYLYFQKKYLKDIHIDEIKHSPLDRAIETKKALGYDDIVSYPERFLTNMDKSSIIRSAFPSIHDRIMHDEIGGPLMEDIRRNVMGAMHRKTSLYITHGEQPKFIHGFTSRPLEEDINKEGEKSVHINRSPEILNEWKKGNDSWKLNYGETALHYFTKGEKVFSLQQTKDKDEIKLFLSCFNLVISYVEDMTNKTIKSETDAHIDILLCEQKIRDAINKAPKKIGEKIIATLMHDKYIIGDEEYYTIYKKTIIPLLKIYYGEK